MKKRIVMGSMLLLIWFSASKNRAEEWRTYTVGDGLKDNVVNAVAVDNQASAVWFGTANGASRFDGVRWDSYLDGVDVRAILVEAPDRMWFGTNQGVFLKAGENFIPFLPGLGIWDIVLDQQGVKWFGTRFGIRSTVDGSTWEDYRQIESNLVETVLRSPRLGHELSAYEIPVDALKWVRTSVTSLAIDRKGRKWLATNVLFQLGEDPLFVSGVGLFDDVTWELPDLKVDSVITSVALDANDNLWYSRFGEGAFFYDGKESHHYLSQDIDGDGSWVGSQNIVTVKDLNGDGLEEVVATASAGYDLQPRGLYLYDLASGRELWHYRTGPNPAPELIAIGDVTGDGLPEIVAGGSSPQNGSTANGTDDVYGYVFIGDLNGQNLWGGGGQSKPLTPISGQIHRLALADLDRDGVKDIIVFLNSNRDYASEDAAWGIVVIDGFGNQKAKFSHHRPFPGGQGGVADLNQDGFMEIIGIDDQGTLMIFDRNLSLLHQQQLEKGTQWVAIAELYGDGLPEILLQTEGRLFVLDSQWTKGELATLWEYTDFQGGARILLSDIEPGGATEILISAQDGTHLLSYDIPQNLPLKSPDTGWRYDSFYSLSRTAVYPHAPSVPLVPKPFQRRHILKEVTGSLYTGDINGDGKLELISLKEDFIPVWTYHDGETKVLWRRRYPGIAITALEYDAGGNLLILAHRFRAGDAPELLVIDARSGAITQSITAEAGVVDELRNNLVNDIKIDRRGEVWFATGGGVSTFDGRRWGAFSLTDGLADEHVNAIAFDASSNMWFATAAGVTKLDRTITRNPPLRFPPTILLRDDAGAIWSGSLGDGIRRYEGGTEKPYLPTGAGSVHEVQSFAVDLKRNLLWASIWENGVERGIYKIHLETAVREGELTFKNSELVSNRVTAMTLDPRDGSLWMGTSPHRSTQLSPEVSGLNKYNPDTGSWESWPLFVDENQSVRNELPIPQSVTALWLTDAGTLWIGTGDEGVRRFDTNAAGKEAWRVFTTADGLASDTINAIAVDAQGMVWFATPNGASRYDEKTGQWQTFTVTDGLAGNLVNDVKAVGQVVWFASNGGVSKYDGNNWITYDTDDGLVSNFVLSIAIDKEGALWMGTSDGRVEVRFGELIPPDTLITSKPGATVGVAGVVFEVSGTDLGTNTPDLLYQHKLVPEGVRPEEVPWSKYDRRTKMAYTGLADGTYTFYVRAVDKDENVDPEPASFMFTVDTGQPVAAIIEPAGGGAVRGVLSIKGLAFDQTDFSDYEVQWKVGTPEAPGKREPLLKRTTPVPTQQENKELASWDTTGLEGFYTLRLIVSDQLGHTSETLVTVIVDNTPPTARLISPTSNQTLSGVIPITGEISDDNIARYTVQWRQGGRETVIETKEVSQSGPVTIPHFDSSSLDGNVTLRLTAYDRAGNASLPAEVDVRFQNEGVRPKARFGNLKDNDVVAGVVEFTGEARSVAPFKNYVVRYAPGLTPSEEAWVELANNSTPPGERLATWNTTSVDDGEYSIQLTVRDDNDYTSPEMVLHIIVDNTPPDIELTSPQSEDIVSGEVSIQGTVFDTHFKSYTVEFAPGVNPETGWEQLGEISASRAIERKWRTDGLDGLYSIRVTARDLAIPIPNQTSLVRTMTLDNTVGQAVITAPENGQVIGGTVEITGTAADDNFSNYQVFWGKGSNPSTWNAMTNRMTSPVVNGLLASWDTAGHDGVYTLRLAAYDKSQHEASARMTVVVDNTDPIAQITLPHPNDQVGTVVDIIGTAKDENFSQYIIEVAKGENPEDDDWIKASKTPLGDEVENDTLFQWPTKGDPGIFTIRLAVTDKANHTSHAQVTVNVRPKIDGKSKSSTESADGVARLYIPPNSLPAPEIITINPVPEAEIQGTVPDGHTHLGVAYDFEPKDLQFKRKPALLTIWFASVPRQPHPNKIVGLYQWQQQGNSWKRIGGTVDVKKGEISAAAMELGRYAIMETDMSDGGEKSLQSLTCQPRVFGKGVYHPSTAIAFQLGGRAQVTVKIYNLARRLKTTLVEHEDMNPGMNVVSWDGTDDDGNHVVSGLYLIVVHTDEAMATQMVKVLNRF